MVGTLALCAKINYKASDILWENNKVCSCSKLIYGDRFGKTSPFPENEYDKLMSH